MAEVTGDLGCGWYTIDGETNRWGEALLAADQGEWGRWTRWVERNPIATPGEVEHQNVDDLGGGHPQGSSD